MLINFVLFFVSYGFGYGNLGLGEWKTNQLFEILSENQLVHNIVEHLIER